MFDGIFLCLQASGKSLLEGIHFLGSRLLGWLLCLLSLLLCLLRLGLRSRAITDCANSGTPARVSSDCAESCTGSSAPTAPRTPEPVVAC
jgi:hypothetical protein